MKPWYKSKELWTIIATFVVQMLQHMTATNIIPTAYVGYVGLLVVAITRITSTGGGLSLK